MKNFKSLIGIPVIVLMGIVSCSKSQGIEPESPEGGDATASLQQVARMLSVLPMESEQLGEVHDAVSSSSVNGYDEEYTMHDLFSSPGAGVGGATKASSYGTTMRDLIERYLSEQAGTKAGSFSPEEYIRTLTESDMQIYWPYSEDWDGETYPIVTFDPGYGAESNYGYEIRFDGDGARIVDSIYVDEAVAMKRPVWVVNTNDDSAFTPVEMLVKDTKAHETQTKSSTVTRKLVVKDFTMLRSYDSWFGGASEFFVKCGAVNGFKASTEAEMKQYQAGVTDFMISVKRKNIGTPVTFDAILLTDFTSQMEKLAFLITEDDGGTVTSWKCSAEVKIKSKTYGFDIEIPYNEKDDIVWRGQLAASFFEEEDYPKGRFGDVKVTFALE